MISAQPGKWLAILLMLLLLAGLPGISPAAQAQAGANHVVILIDQSGTMARLHRSAGISLGTCIRGLVADQLPRELAAASPPFSGSLWQPNRDYVSVYLFGMPKERPSFEGNFLQPICLFQQSFSFEALGNSLQDLTRTAIERDAFNRHWSAISCAIPFGIHAAGLANQTEAKIERTIIIRISDDRYNGEHANQTELFQLQARHLDPNLRWGLPADERITDFFYASNVFTEVGRDFVYNDPDKTTMLLWDGAELRRRPGGMLTTEDSGFRGLSALITETVPLLRHQFDGVFKPKSEEIARRLPNGQYDLNLELELVDDFQLRFPDLKPVCLGVGTTSEEGEFTPLSQENPYPTLAPGIPFALRVGTFQRVDLLPALRVIAYFQRPGSSNPSQLVSYWKDIVVKPEPDSKVLGVVPVGDAMLRVWPNLPQSEVATRMGQLAFLLVILLIAFVAYLILEPFVPKLKLRPLRNSTIQPLSIDYTHLEWNPILTTSLEVRDRSGKPWLRRRPGKLEKIHIVPETDGDHSETSNFVLVDEKASFVRLSLDAHSEIKSVKHRHGEPIPLVVVPAALKDYQSTRAERRDTFYHFRVAYQPTNGAWLFWFLSRGLAKARTEVISLPITVHPERPTVEWKIEPKSGAEHCPGQMVHCANLIAQLTTKRQFVRDAEIEFSFVLRESGPWSRGSRQGTLVAGRLDDEVVAGAEDLDEETKLSTVDVRVGAENSVQPLCLPLYLNCRSGYVPNPDGEATEYLLTAGASSDSATLVAVNGGSARVTLLRDPSVNGLLLRAAFPARASEKAEVLLDPSALASGMPCVIDLATRLGPIEAVSGTEFVRPLFNLDLGNTAKSGSGSVEISLRHDEEMLITSCSEALDPDRLIQAFEVRDDTTGERCPLRTLNQSALNQEGKQFPAGDQEPTRLQLLFHPGRVAFKLEQAVGRFTLAFKVDWTVHESTTDEKGHSFSRELLCHLALRRNLGHDFLSIDFGTSALVVAFAEGQDYVTRNVRALQKAVLPLSRHLEAGQRIEDKTNENLIPTTLNVRRRGDDGKQIISVDLPYKVRPTDDAVGGEFLGYLKKAIVRDITHAPLARTVAADSGSSDTKAVQPDALLLRDVVVGAYRTLFDQYVKKILDDENQWDKLCQVVLTHPNNYLIHHRALVRQWVKQAEKKILVEPLMLSESDAIVYWYMSTVNGSTPTDEERVLTYDIGAGTLDISIRTIRRRDGEIIGNELEHLYTRAGAGDELDVMLARAIHDFLKELINSDPNLQYRHKLFGAVDNSIASSPDYRVRLRSLKAELTKLKISYAKARGKMRAKELRKARLPVLLESISQVAILEVGHDTVLDADDVEQRFKHSPSGPILQFPATRVGEIVKEFLEINVDHVLGEALGETLEGRGVDTVIITGRTGLLPGLADQVQKKLISLAPGHKVPRMIHFQEDPRQAKEGVALGALKWATHWRQEVPTKEPPPIHGVYGVIIDRGEGPEWKRLFGPEDPVLRKETFLGQEIPLLAGEIEIDLAGLRYIKLRYSQCPDPERHVTEPDNRTFWGALSGDTITSDQLRSASGGTQEEKVVVEFKVVISPKTGPAIRATIYRGGSPIEVEGSGAEIRWKEEDWPLSQIHRSADGPAPQSAALEDEDEVTEPVS